MKRIRELELRRWVPTHLDLETASYSDVDKILKVLDDYSFKILSVINKEPRLPFIIKIQRFVRSFMRQSKLKRFVRDIMKINKLVQCCEGFKERKLCRMPFKKVRDDIYYEKETAERKN
jgi:hypothetical protein